MLMSMNMSLNSPLTTQSFSSTLFIIDPSSSALWDYPVLFKKNKKFSVVFASNSSISGLTISSTLDLNKGS